VNPSQLRLVVYRGHTWHINLILIFIKTEIVKITIKIQRRGGVGGEGNGNIWVEIIWQKGSIYLFLLLPPPTAVIRKPMDGTVSRRVSFPAKKKFTGTDSLDPLRFMRGFLPDISKGNSFTKGFLSGY
jgi:hypothetical protein